MLQPLCLYNHKAPIPRWVHSLWDFSLLWYPLPDKAIKLFFSFAPKNSVSEFEFVFPGYEGWFFSNKLAHPKMSPVTVHETTVFYLHSFYHFWNLVYLPDFCPSHVPWRQEFLLVFHCILSEEQCQARSRCSVSEWMRLGFCLLLCTLCIFKHKMSMTTFFFIKKRKKKKAGYCKRQYPQQIVLR